MVTIPPTITASISLWVRALRYGRINKGASVWPMKMFAAALRLSLPLVRITRCIIRAMTATTLCKMPQ